MDYFFMNEFTFKLLISNNQTFILKLLKSININIEFFDLFEIDIETKNQKIDLLLFSRNLAINFELNKTKKSLKRNKIYAECLAKILPSYKIIQININTFDTNNNYKTNNLEIINLHQENDYIKFITAKNPLRYKTNNKSINQVIKIFNNIDIKTLEKDIYKIERIKEYLDSLIKD